MPINASPHFEGAQAEYEQSQTTEQKIKCLKKMLVLSPKHKGAENLNAQLKKRLARLKSTKEKEDKSGKSRHKGIKKEEMQATIIGFTNAGKSSLLKALTKAEPKITPYNFTTKKPIVGMMPFSGTHIQLIEIPAIGSEYYDKGIVNTTDTIIILVDDIKEIEKIQEGLDKSSGKKIIAYNIKNDKENLRKIESTLRSKRYNFVLINPKTKQGFEELKEKLFESLEKIRIYTKEPGKSKSEKPMILEKNAMVLDIAKKVLKNKNSLKETKIWGPSSKFPGQVVGLTHQLKDLDVIEFKTR